MHKANGSLGSAGPFGFGPVWGGAEACATSDGERVELLQFRGLVRGWLQENMPAAWPYQSAGRGLADFDDGVVARQSLERALGARGLIGLAWPISVGGGGKSILFDVVVEEEIAFARGPMTPFANGRTLLGPTLLEFGSREQQERNLPGILTGTDYWCQGFSEPGAGSDLASLRTRGEIQGDMIRVFGHKIWTTLAHRCNRMFALVRTTRGSSAHEGLSLLLMELPSAGVSIHPIKQANGDSEFCEVFIDGAEVPTANVVGGVGSGWRVAMGMFSFERGAHFMGVHLRIRSEIEELSRLLGARPHLSSQNLDQQIDDLRVESDAFAALLYRSVAKVAQGEPPGPETSILKLCWTELHQRVLDCALGIATAIQQKDPVDPEACWWVHQRLSGLAETVFAGTSEIQRDIVGERVLGLPKSRKRQAPV